MDSVFMHLVDRQIVSLEYHVQSKAYPCLRQYPGAYQSKPEPSDPRSMKRQMSAYFTCATWLFDEYSFIRRMHAVLAKP